MVEEHEVADLRRRVRQSESERECFGGKLALALQKKSQQLEKMYEVDKARAKSGAYHGGLRYYNKDLSPPSGKKKI